MLERLTESVDRFPGVRWATFEPVAEDFSRRHPRRGGEGLPREQTESNPAGEGPGGAGEKPGRWGE